MTEDSGDREGPAMESTNEALLVTVADGMRLLSVGRNAIWNLINSGELRSVKIGRSRRIPRTEIEAYVARLSETQR